MALSSPAWAFYHFNLFVRVIIITSCIWWWWWFKPGGESHYIIIGKGSIVADASSVYLLGLGDKLEWKIDVCMVYVCERATPNGKVYRFSGWK
jgi:hypothetical protein